MTLNLGFRYSVNHDDSQWVTNEAVNDGTRYVFGRIDQKTVSVTTRFNYTMTPTLSLQLYAEPFVSAGEYSNYKELVDGRAENYPDRYRAYGYGGNADFNIRSFRTTNVPALGIPSRLADVRRLAAGQVGLPGLRRLPLRPGLRGRVRGAFPQRLPGQVQLLAEYVGNRPTGQQANGPTAGRTMISLCPSATSSATSSTARLTVLTNVSCACRPPS
jgi:hypothetical protein